MECDCITLPYDQTAYFSTLVTDYIKQSPRLAAFYTHAPNINGIKAAIEQRKQFATPRAALTTALKAQYQDVPNKHTAQAQIALLEQSNTFTVTTAHQPNIATGPLYFIYKIAHAIQLSSHLQQQMPEYNFVPVYYMGSEDADLEELNHFTIDGKRYTWHTKQTGAVGRMLVDEAFIALLHELEKQISVLPYGKWWLQTLQTHYKIGVSIQEATFSLVHELFGNEGLIILIPDNKLLKATFTQVIQQEITTQFSSNAVTATIQQLAHKGYKVQAAGRDINLFYLTANKRERITKTSEGNFEAPTLGLSFTQVELLQLVHEQPELFSANVILRGVFQETVLPNVAFIGGGGELAYWLELKAVFEAAAVPYPVLVLRNSFLIMQQQQWQQWQRLGFDEEHLFQPTHQLLTAYVEQHSEAPLLLETTMEALQNMYEQLAQQVAQVDSTLVPHVASLQTRAAKKITQLEQKLLRAEKRKFSEQQLQIQRIQAQLFPNNNLQERVENIGGFVARYGKDFIQELLTTSLTLEQQFSILLLPNFTQVP
jgi:bacillithiol biosynthesis cysteine-adding enzyme BshC